MMEQEQDKPFAREAWQRLLREGVDAPSEATDLRIHAEARRALASRPIRWWVPASLAASFVLVVMLVQLQYAGLSRVQSIGESEAARQVAQPKPAIILNAPAEDDDASAITAAPAAPADAAELDRQFKFTHPAAEVPPPSLELPMMDGPTTAVTGSLPEAAREEREASELKRERADSPPAAMQESEASPGRNSAIGNLGAVQVSGNRTRSPEDWYAEIEALRKAGRIEEAEAELKKLEAAHPGWLEQHHSPKP